MEIGLIIGVDVIKVSVGPRYAPEKYMLMPSGIVPQLQMGMHIPVTVAQNTPEIFFVPRVIFFSRSVFRNSRSAPATIKLKIIHGEALHSILHAETMTSRRK